MNDDTRCLMSLCRAGLMKRTPPPPPEHADAKHVIALAKKHKVSALTAQALLESGLFPKEAERAARAALDTARYVEAVQCFETAELTRRFSAAGIDYCLLKGWHWRMLYPAPYDRDMGDVDILVRLSDWTGARNAADACGFDRSENQEIDLHTVLYKGDVKVELHRSLLSSHGRYEGRDKNVWDTLVPGAAPHEWRLSPTDDYLYFFLHAEKHTASYGFELRTLTDIYALRVFGQKIDRARFEREAKRLGLLGYAENLEALSSAWMAGKALTGEQEETLDYLMSLETLTNDEKTYRAARRWLALNLTPAGLWRRLIVPRDQLLSRCEEAKTKKEAMWRCLMRAKKTYRMYLGEFFVFRKRIPKERRQALARAARRLYRGI